MLTNNQSIHGKVLPLLVLPVFCSCQQCDVSKVLIPIAVHRIQMRPKHLMAYSDCQKFALKFVAIQWGPMGMHLYMNS